VFVEAIPRIPVIAPLANLLHISKIVLSIAQQCVNMEIGPPGRTALFLAVAVYNFVKGLVLVPPLPLIHPQMLILSPILVLSLVVPFVLKLILPALELRGPLKSVILRFAQRHVRPLNGEILLIGRAVVPPKRSLNVLH